MCYANGASAQLPSASPPTPIKSKTLKDSATPAEVCPTPASLHSKASSSGQDSSFTSTPAPQDGIGAEGKRRGVDTERQVVCTCSTDAAHSSERHCKLHRYTSSSVERKQGSMEPVVTGRQLPEWNQTNGANAAFFPNSPIPSLSPSPPMPAALPSAMVGPPYAGYHWLPGLYYQPIARYRHDKSDRLEVCRDFIRGTCVRSPEECRFAHPGDNIIFDESDCTVIVCMDFIKGSCTRPHCKYLHPPPHLQNTVRARQNRIYFSTPQSPMYSTPGAFVPQGYSGQPQAVAYPMQAAPTGYVGGYQPAPMYLPMPVAMPSPPPAYYPEPVQPPLGSPISSQPSPAQHVPVTTTTFPSAFEEEARSTHTTCGEEGRNAVIEHTLE